MTCIRCGQEIRKNDEVGFFYGMKLETYPVCKTCMDRLILPTQAETEIENSQENYTPGIIEEEL